MFFFNTYIIKITKLMSYILIYFEGLNIKNFLYFIYHLTFLYNIILHFLRYIDSKMSFYFKRSYNTIL